jgi:hypothetical protein
MCVLFIHICVCICMCIYMWLYIYMYIHSIHGGAEEGGGAGMGEAVLCLQLSLLSAVSNPFPLSSILSPLPSTLHPPLCLNSLSLYPPLFYTLFSLLSALCSLLSALYTPLSSIISALCSLLTLSTRSWSTWRGIRPSSSTRRRRCAPR